MFLVVYLIVLASVCLLVWLYLVWLVDDIKKALIEGEKEPEEGSPWT